MLRHDLKGAGTAATWGRAVPERRARAFRPAGCFGQGSGSGVEPATLWAVYFFMPYTGRRKGRGVSPASGMRQSSPEFFTAVRARLRNSPGGRRTV